MKARRTDYVFTTVFARGERGEANPKFNSDEIFKSMPLDVRRECFAAQKVLLDAVNKYAWYEQTISLSGEITDLEAA